MKDTWNKIELATAYRNNVVKLQGVPKDIVSDWDARFISRFWQELQELMGTTLKMITAFHPATDRQMERAIKTWKDMLRACVMEFSDRQKSYADLHRGDIEFQVGDKVLFKVSPMVDVIQFFKRGKLSQNFISSSKVLDRVGELAYRLALPPTSDRVHNVFHVSQLRKYINDPSHVLELRQLN
ncbi:uncharacterized protein LOC141601319 [Silene latifolia]|uniref:uncharacterized protein LOC141601319 n=1 Tax=Silene latifolia TaxID=37657 RepID=UPI003D772729